MVVAPADDAKTASSNAVNADGDDAPSETGQKQILCGIDVCGWFKYWGEKKVQNGRIPVKSRHGCRDR